MTGPEISLNLCQKKALNLLNSGSNAFLTGAAGSGKSFLIRHFLSDKSAKKIPVLASTGSAAILVGGRTFHSFFGLGIMQGGIEATVQRALGNKRVVRRLTQVDAVVIDEISMIPGSVLRAAEKIARLARTETSKPWGGIRIIAVGDFAQLPPVQPFQRASQRDWAFLDSAWESSEFKSTVLKTVVRTQEQRFLEILNHVRNGNLNEEVSSFLNEKTDTSDSNDGVDDYDGTRLFPLRESTEKFNLYRLAQIEGEEKSFPTLYFGNKKLIQDLRRISPVPENLKLKEGALIMLRMNDPQGRWVNGSLGEIQEISDQLLIVQLKAGRIVEIERVSFSMLDGDGNVIASATNFPVNLAYASTIHKAQGMTLDRVWVDLRNLWEPGQAYVALSRVKNSSGLQISGWTRDSIKMDSNVRKFYQLLDAAS